MGVFNALSKMTFVGIYFLSNYYSSMGAKLKHCRTCKMSKFNYTVFFGKNDSRCHLGKIKRSPQMNTLNKRNGRTRKLVIYNYI